MKSAAKLMLSTLVIAAAGALTGTPAQAGTHPTEWLDAQFKPSTRTRAEVRAEALEANRRRNAQRPTPLAANTR